MSRLTIRCRPGRLVALALICAAASAATAASAAAAPPEWGRCVAVPAGTGAWGNAGCTMAGGMGKFEWMPGPGASPQFTGALSSSTAKIETVSKETITCTGGAIAGHYENPTTALFEHLTLLGCRLPTGAPCQVPNNEEGQIDTIGLQGRLGIITANPDPAKDKIGVKLFHFDEGIECGGIEKAVNGAVIVPLKANKMLTSETLKFKASKGKQKPEAFEGEPPELFEVGFEQAGLTGTFTLANEEAIEANTVA